MKPSWSVSFLLLTALALGCSQAAPPPERVRQAEQGLGEPGCATVKLHAPGAAGDGNVGVASGEPGPCAGPITVSSDDYYGSSYCPSQAIVELDHGTSWYIPTVSPTTMPTTQADCTQTQVTMGVYGDGKLLSSLTESVTGTWDAKNSYCSFFSPNYFDTAPYQVVRVAGHAYRWTTLKGSPYLVNLPVTVSLESPCIR